MSSDQSFITNEGDNTLKIRFNKLLQSSINLDVLVGYFYASGFYEIYEDLEDLEKIRIIVGINTDKQIKNLIAHSLKDSTESTVQNIRKTIKSNIKTEYEVSADNDKVFKGSIKFLEWLKNDKLEIKAYPDDRIHAKMYVFGFKKDDRDLGRVITGSSNLTLSGLEKNIELNVELKNKSDYQFAKDKFEELWAKSHSIDIAYQEALEENTWINQNITPYELYLKFLYEYFYEELHALDEVKHFSMPKGFKNYKYQEDAVLFAYEKLKRHHGVFISDVVGLGKTYITCMLLKIMGGNSLIIAPPNLRTRENPGSWENIKSDFELVADTESYAKLEPYKDKDLSKYSNIVIDEAHIFRNELSKKFEQLAHICKNKKVILVSATPYNNKPDDIYNLLKLFQNTRKSTIRNNRDLEDFFNDKRSRIAQLNYIDLKNRSKVRKDIATEIRKEVLSDIMLRRTRKEVSKYYKEDIDKQNLFFPDIETPKPFYYELGYELNIKFEDTLKKMQNLRMVRYSLKDQLKISNVNYNQVRGLSGFLKTTLVKRLESSFYAFKKSINVQVNVYQSFLDIIKNRGVVYVSSKHLNKILEYVEDERDDEIEKLLKEDKGKRHNISEFHESFVDYLKEDLEILTEVHEMWENIEVDPKINKLIEEIKNNKLLNDKNNKFIIFTEAVDTALYLESKLNDKLKEEVLLYTGKSTPAKRNKVISNFDANVADAEQDHTYRILIATESLSEGVNLHRARAVINYDIPWNPSRVIQRLGRINRVNTKMKKIYSFSFFPVDKVEEVIGLQDKATRKLEMFMEILGEDSSVFNDNIKISSHELFKKITNVEESEDEGADNTFKYLMEIRNIKEKNKELFEKIKSLPLKARVGKDAKNYEPGLITFFRQGRDINFIKSELSTKNAANLDFFEVIDQIKSKTSDERLINTNSYFELLDINKKEYNKNDIEFVENISNAKLSTAENKILETIEMIHSKTKKLSEDENRILDNVVNLVNIGALQKYEITILNTLIQNVRAKNVDKNILKKREKYQRMSYKEKCEFMHELLVETNLIKNNTPIIIPDLLINKQNNKFATTDNKEIHKLNDGNWTYVIGYKGMLSACKVKGVATKSNLDSLYMIALDKKWSVDQLITRIEKIQGLGYDNISELIKAFENVQHNKMTIDSAKLIQEVTKKEVVLSFELIDKRKNN